MPYKDKVKQREYQRQWVKEKFSNPEARNKLKSVKTNAVIFNRENLREYKKDLSCAQCGETHYACLDFHHINTDNKEKNISDMVSSGYKWDSILEEINKCIVLCANCHRKLHYN